MSEKPPIHATVNFSSGQLCLRRLLALPLLSLLPGACNPDPKATSISILPLRGLNVLSADLFYVV